MLTCEDCGAQLADDADECVNCATPVERPSGSSQVELAQEAPVEQDVPLTPPPPPSPELILRSEGQIAQAPASSPQSYWQSLSPPVQVGLMISPATLVLEILNAMTGCLAMLITKPLLLVVFGYQGILLAKKLAAEPHPPTGSLFRHGAVSGLVAQALPAVWWTVAATVAAGATVGIALLALPLVLASMALTIGANMLITGFMAKHHYSKLRVP